MGIINLQEEESVLPELTLHRPLAAVPFGGRYRLIDFALSNMVNSGIRNVGILVHQKYRSLMDHLRSGKEWDLARKKDGLVILPPAFANYPLHPYRGDVENFHSNLDYLHKSQQKYVVISGVNVVCNIDYRQVIKYHQKVNADITIVYSKLDCCKHDCSNYTGISIQPDGQIIDMQVNPAGNSWENISMNIFVMEKQLLVDLVDTCIAHGDYDFAKHCIVKNLSRLRVFAYRHEGYIARIHCIQSYFHHNMDLLKQAIWQELFFQSGLVYTKVKDEPPAKYNNKAVVANSLVAGGCVINGTVENSILFRGVKVHADAYIKDSIVMQKSEIAGNTILENVICDKDVTITAGKKLRGENNYPLVVRKGTVI